MEFPTLEFDGVADNIIEPSKFIKKMNISDYSGLHSI